MSERIGPLYEEHITVLSMTMGDREQYETVRCLPLPLSPHSGVWLMSTVRTRRDKCLLTGGVEKSIPPTVCCSQLCPPHVGESKKGCGIGLNSQGKSLRHLRRYSPASKMWKTVQDSVENEVLAVGQAQETRTCSNLTFTALTVTVSTCRSRLKTPRFLRRPPTPQIHHAC